MEFKNIKNKLRVMHYPNIPCIGFEVEVKDEEQAFLLLNTLANQHLFLFEYNFIPDYSNMILVQMFEDGEWIDYYNEEIDEEWSYIEEYFNSLS